MRQPYRIVAALNRPSSATSGPTHASPKAADQPRYRPTADLHEARKRTFDLALALTFMGRRQGPQRALIDDAV
jgi:hypothetical protein